MLRQTIVDVICAYLRMPYTPPPTRRAPPSRASSASPHLRLDLTGAALANFNLSHCRIDDAMFDEVSFTGPVVINGATFASLARHFDLGKHGIDRYRAALIPHVRAGTPEIAAPSRRIPAAS
ncbi:hypothetical protein AB0F17_54425 [Nonomuraea sp. NPDC026600]|uniref:hypothetical protein n=1 Tax=Nonomuraea sp. NPDC026600 TaxID=3155363 RepID=UPI00340BF1A2